MIFEILTIFPDFFNSFLESSIIKKAIDKKKITVNITNIRDFSKQKHKKVDKKPFGASYGMLMMAEPIFDAISFVKKKHKDKLTKTIFLSPQGKIFDQEKAFELESSAQVLILLCGHYEGVDERIINKSIDEEISIGNFITTGGEIGASIIIDSVSRLIDGVLSKKESYVLDTFSNNLLKHAQYTKPYTFEKEDVPKELLSGNHKKIEDMQLENSLKRTFLKRFDLLAERKFSKKEKDILKNWIKDIEKLIEN